MPNQWSYFSCLAVLGACEFPLSAFVFAVVGGNANVWSMLAVPFVIAIPIAAHFAGRLLKRRAERRINLALFIVISLSLVFLFWYFGEAAFLSVGCDERFRVTSFGPSPCDEGLVSSFVLLNLILFGLAVCLAYVHHDQKGKTES